MNFQDLRNCVQAETGLDEADLQMLTDLGLYMESYRAKVHDACDELREMSEFDATVKEMKVRRYETIAYATVLSKLLRHFSDRLSMVSPKNSIHVPKSSPDYLAAVSAAQGKFQMYLKLKCMVRRQAIAVKNAVACL